MPVSITVLYYVFEFLRGLSMVFYDFSQVIHQATVLWKSALTASNSVSLCFQFLVLGMQPGIFQVQIEVQHLSVATIVVRATQGFGPSSS